MLLFVLIFDRIFLVSLIYVSLQIIYQSQNFSETGIRKNFQKKRSYFVVRVLRDLRLVDFRNSSPPSSAKQRKFFEILISVLAKEPVSDRHLFTMAFYIEKTQFRSLVPKIKLKCSCLKDRQTHTAKNSCSQRWKKMKVISKTVNF